MTKVKKQKHKRPIIDYSIAHGGLYITCFKCDHMARINPHWLPKEYQELTDWSPITEKMKCTKCGAYGGEWKGFRASD